MDGAGYGSSDDEAAYGGSGFVREEKSAFACSAESKAVPSRSFGERRQRVRPLQKDAERIRGRRDRARPWQKGETVVQQVLPYTREANNNNKSMYEDHVFASKDCNPPSNAADELQQTLWRSQIETSQPEAPWARYKTEEEEEDDDLARAIANSLREQ